MNDSIATNTEKNKVDSQYRHMPKIFIGLSLVSAVLILISISQPYWRMVLDAPQYPQGLEMRVFVNRMTGDEDETLDDVAEIDGLNHYIGMQSLYNAAQLERSIALPAVTTAIILVIISAVWKSRWSWLLALPAIGFPYVFLGDLAFWLNFYGQNLDPYAPLSSAIKPFTPPILGEGVIGNFRTIASVEAGWFLAVAASAIALVMIVLKIVYQRRQSHV